MGKNLYLSNGYLNVVFNGATLANLLENASVAPLTQLWLSLHTSDPGPTGTQLTNEIAYASYARAAVNRNTGSWPATATGTISLANNVNWPTSTDSGSPIATYLGIGIAASGAGALLYSGPLSPAVACSSGVTPQLNTATTVTEM